MDKKEFVNKLKGAPLKEAQTIDDYAKRVDNHPDVEKQYHPDDGWHYYSAAFLLPITIPDTLTEDQIDKSFSALSSVSDFNICDEGESEVIIFVNVPADLKGFEIVGDYVAALEHVLDFVDNKDAHIAKIMNNPKVKKVVEKYNLQKN